MEFFRIPTPRSLTRWWLGVAISSFVIAANVSARDMHGRVGLGYNGQFATTLERDGVPGISVKYALTRDVAVAAVFGIRTAAPANSVTGLKLFKNIFLETNLNFYAFLAGGLLTADGASSAEFQGGFGSEFFIPGLESLGFSIETGASLSNLTGNFIVKTIGVSFLSAGVHFYF